jgi:hypothetical protein
MKKIIYLTFVLSLFIFSCSSEDGQNNSNSGPVLLRRSITTNSQGTQTTNFNYDGNKIVSTTTSDGFENKYYYTGELITKYEIYNNTILIHTRHYSYNSQNNLSSTIELNHGNNQGNRSTLTYNSNGTITYNMYLGDLISQTGLYGTFTATISNSEITSLKNESNNIIYTSTYDSKNHFMKNVLGFSKIRMDLGSGTYRNVRGVFQNLTELKITPQTGSQYINETVQLTYNADNFPVSGTSRVYSSTGALLSTESSLLYYE